MAEEKRSYPQPREGIEGVLRQQDDLLSLAPGVLPVREMIRTLALHLQRACLVGNPAPVVERMGERLRNPQIGDLVIEQSTAFHQDPEKHIQGFGILIAERQEWWSTDEEWEAELAAERAFAEEHHFSDVEPEERMTDHAWYVQYGRQPEDVCRWVNCSFLVVPIGDERFDIPAGYPSPTGGTVFTRESLLGSLADAGFQLRDTKPQ